MGLFERKVDNLTLFYELSAIFCVYIYDARTTHPCPPIPCSLYLTHIQNHTSVTHTHKNKYKLSIVIRDADNVLMMEAAQIQRQATIGAIETG